VFTRGALNLITHSEQLTTESEALRLEKMMSTHLNDSTSMTPTPLPLMRFQHSEPLRAAEVDYHEAEQVWSVTICHEQGRRVHGLYPSLASAQLILCALGFRRVEVAAS